MSRIVYDKGGKITFADVPNAGVTRVDPNAKSGNPHHDARSGKFGGGGGKKRAPTIETPANVDPLEFARMTDAVRDAAREFEDFDEGKAMEFLQARAKDPSVVDLQAFLARVREQHVTDLVDILDSQLRTQGIRSAGKRKVKVSAPRGYVQKVVKNLSDDEVTLIMHRLESRGHPKKAVDQYFDRRRDGNDAAKEKRDAVAASNQWDTDLLEEAMIEFEESENTQGNAVGLAVQLAEKIAGNIKMPDIKVEPVINVNMPEEKPKRVVRDAKGLVSHTEVIDG